LRTMRLRARFPVAFAVPPTCRPTAFPKWFARAAMDAFEMPTRFSPRPVAEKKLMAVECCVSIYVYIYTYKLMLY
jgi:hypothetical protein